MSGWTRAQDPERVHELLMASDRAIAGPAGEVPARSLSSSVTSVEQGWVWVLREDSDIVAMVTVSPVWTGQAAALEHFPPTPSPRYMRRLAVRPDLHGSGDLLSLSAIRKAVEVAREEGGTAVRCETNPGNVAAVAVLRSARFVPCGPEPSDGPRDSVLFHRTWEPAPERVVPA